MKCGIALCGSENICSKKKLCRVALFAEWNFSQIFTVTTIILILYMYT